MGYKNIIKKIFTWIKQRSVYYGCFKYIKDMRSGHAYAKLSREQKKEIQDYYKKHFGSKISLKWHEYYLYVNKTFSPRYIPTYIYNANIFPQLNDTRISVVYSDKNMIDTLLQGKVKLPKTYVKNINGHFYIENNLVSYEEALASCINIDDAVIKHTIDTAQGESIIRFKSVNGKAITKDFEVPIEELINRYGKDYIVQAAIKQNDVMASLNPTSLNTIRIMTYWSKKGIVPVFAVVRMGRKGSVVDNASAGGLYCGINMDGSLKAEAYTLKPLSVHTQSDSGVVFKDFRIPQFDRLKAKAVELHSLLPYAKIIGWDLSINQNEEIELVEINAMNPGVFQAATGPAFGDYTEEILESCRN